MRTSWSLLIMLALAVMLAGSCDVLNPGGDPQPSNDITVTLTTPAGMSGGQFVHWQVTWTGGAAPYTIEMNMGGGAELDLAAGTAGATPFTHEFKMVNPSLTDDANYTYTVRVTDANALVGTATGNYAVGPQSGVPGYTLAADTLYAIPLSDTVATDNPLTVIVATGVPADPFQFMNGVGLTIESDADKVTNSFNAGALGSGPGDVDGFWTAMNPSGQFLLPPDGFIIATDIGGGRERWDFNLTPVDGSDQAAAEGALFNFQFTFGAAGTKTFGFQEFEAINRTYYSGSSVTERFWGDITNDHAGIPNSVVVN